MDLRGVDFRPKEPLIQRAKILDKAYFDVDGLRSQFYETASIALIHAQILDWRLPEERVVTNRHVYIFCKAPIEDYKDIIVLRFPELPEIGICYNYGDIYDHIRKLDERYGVGIIHVSAPADFYKLTSGDWIEIFDMFLFFNSENNGIKWKSLHVEEFIKFSIFHKYRRKLASYRHALVEEREAKKREAEEQQVKKQEEDYIRAYLKNLEEKVKQRHLQWLEEWISNKEPLRLTKKQKKDIDIAAQRLVDLLKKKKKD